MKLSFRQRLLASTLLVGAVAAPNQAWAQSTDQSPEPPATSEPDPNAGAQDPGSPSASEPAGEIIITGSRIPRPDLTSSSPLAVVQDEEFKLSGANNVEQVINTLPQVVPSLSAFSNNPGGGVALLNLRGLGSQRNLVLVNGRRWIFFDANQIVDLNTIPPFLLDSVDVVTGGASAVYGSDALAGVTNFHLRTDLEGALVGGSYAITQRGDGPRYNAYGALGTRFADDRGFVTVFGEYYNRGSVFQNQRDFSRFTFVDGATGLVPGGSSNVPQGRFTAPATVNVDPDGPGPLAPVPFVIAGPSSTTGTGIFAPTASGATAGGFFGTPGTATRYCGAACSYNYAPSNYLMTPQKRWALGGYGEYEVIEGHNLYSEVYFTNNQSPAELAATPITQPVNVNLALVCGGADPMIDAATCAALTTLAANQAAANAFAAANGRPLPFGNAPAGTGTVTPIGPGEVRLTANYRATQISNRINEDDRNAFRGLFGARGEITDDWNYDVYYAYARTKNAQIQRGNISRSAFAREVEAGTCNIFGADQLSDECIEAVSILAQNQEESVLQVAQGSVSGTLFTSPWARDAVGLAAGVEWRKMEAAFVPDTSLSSGDVVGFNAGDPTEGQYNVKEVFGELRLPLIQDNFISRLELNAAGRYSDYSLANVGGVWTYSAGAELEPIRDIMFRGQYQRAVRAPNVQELFGGAAVGFPAATDPCATPEILADATAVAVCIATGVPADQVGNPGLQPNPQIEGAFGGNPNLQEEVGDTYTAGVVLRPRFVPRLNIAVDWYDIRVKNAIAAAGGGVGGVLDLCYNVIQDANSAICQLINRDPSGVLSGAGVFIVEANNANLSELRTKGVDFQIDYSLPMSFGLLSPRSRLSAYFFGNYQWVNKFAPVAGLEFTECAGRFGNLCGNPTPKWKWTSRAAWLDGPLTTSLRWRHVGKVSDDDDQTDYIVENVGAYDLFDLTFGLNVTDNATLTFGINNLFDKKPPLMGDNAEQGNTYPSTYDPLGRDFFVSANFNL